MWAPPCREAAVEVSQTFKRISPQLTWTRVLGLETVAHHTVASEALSTETNTAARSLVMGLPRE